MSTIERKVFFKQLDKERAGVQAVLSESFCARVLPGKVPSIHYIVRNRKGVKSLLLWDSGHALGNMWTGATERECEQEGVTVDSVVTYLERHGATLHKRLCKHTSRPY